LRARDQGGAAATTVIIEEQEKLHTLADGRAGAQFRRADLQLHTPVDRNFRAGEPVDSPDERAAFAAAYIERAIERRLGLIAVTEHNDVSWVDELRGAAAGTPLVVFPGFEVASSEGCHVLCLYEPGESTSRLEEVLTEIGLPSAKRFHDDGSPRLAKLDLVALVAFVQEETNGLCILSHVDREDGVLHRLKGEPRINAWKGCGAYAVQASKNPTVMDDGFYKTTLLNKPGYYQRDRAYACIQTSDARTLAEIGSKFSYIKLSADSLDGLRQAFFDPESRVRHPDELASVATPKILAAVWSGAFLEAELPLNPDLNCLVGGKGSAKSTFIESLRHAFDLEIAAPEIGEQAEALLRETFPQQAKLSLLVEVPDPKPTRYVIERTGRDRPLVRDATSGEIISGLAPSAVMRPIVFGQKEIWETAQRVESQLALLDRYCQSELTSLLRESGAALAQLGEIADEDSRVGREVERLAGEVTALPALIEQKRRFDEAGLAGKLSEQRALAREREQWGRARERVGEHDRLVTDLRTDVRDLGGMRVPDQLVNKDLLQQVEGLLAEVESAWKQATDAAHEAVSQARAQLDELERQWHERFEARRADFDAAVAEVAGEHGEPKIQEYLELDSRIARLEEFDKRVATHRQTLSDLATRRDERLAELRELRRRIFAVRERKARDLTDELGDDVRITVKHQGNRTAVFDALCGLRSGANRVQLKRLVEREDFSPAEFAARAREGESALVRTYGLTDGAAAQLHRALDTDTLAAVEMMQLEDGVEISLDVGTSEHPDHRPLERLSAGQRSTAILLLALLESEGPLILDQPEDDLDNRFIYEGVVRRLRDTKEQRQFLIATHNANIPVLGDAEQIIILAAEQKGDRLRAHVAQRGSIDDADLHGPLEDVLEGGREAFERRKQKYGF